MMWKIINALPTTTLLKRAELMVAQLRMRSNSDLLEFHVQASRAFREAFSTSTYRLYCAAFHGEANGGGLTDFCSNLIISGEVFFRKIVNNPDQFSDLEDIQQYNEDNGVDVSQVACEILTKRVGPVLCEQMIHEAAPPDLYDIWNALEAEVGEVDFDPDWPVIQEILPNIYARFKNERTSQT